MAQSLLELSVGTGKWDAGLKKATSSLNAFVQSQGGLNQALDKENQKMGTFVKMMGDMTSKATTAKGQMNDYKRTIEQLTAQYNQMTDAQKKAVGADYTAAIEKIKIKYQEAAREVQNLNNSLNGVSSSGGLKGLMGGISGKLGLSPAMFTGLGAAVATAGAAFKAFGDNVRTAMNFETSMSKLSSLTGKTGKDLETLKEYAIELGSTTTLTASQVADAFRLIGSQQPQLLESSEALKEVTKQAITLSEAAGIDLATASQTLSTSINQMGGDSKNAARFVNVLAAASQKGAGDIAWLGEAITKSGTAAKAVGVSYEELVANLEQLAKAGFDASTAGTALRSIIMNLEKQANSQFKPSIVGLTQAFENLGKANLSIVEYQKLTGKMFATQAMALADAATEAKKMQEAITGTNIAEEQAATNTDNLSGSLKSLASAWEGLNLHINSSNGFLKTCVDWLKDVVKWADAAFTSAGRAAKELAKMQGGGEKDGKHIDTRTEAEVKEVKAATQGEGDAAKIKQQQIIDKYQQEIDAYKRSLEAIRKWQAGDRSEDVHKQMTEYQKLPGTNGIPLNKGIELIENRLKALNTMLNEFKTESDKVLNPAAPTPEPTKPTPSITEEDDDKGNKNKTESKTKELTPLQDVQKKISDLTNEALTADEARLEVIRKEIAALNEQLKVYKEIQDYASGKEPKLNTPVGDRKAFEAEQKRKFNAYDEIGKYDLLGSAMEIKINKELQDAAKKVDVATLKSLLTVTNKNGIEGIYIPSDELMKKIMGQGVDIPDSYWKELETKINEKLREMKLDPIKLNFDTGNVTSVTNDALKNEKAWENAAFAVQQLGSALNGLEDPAAKVAGTIAQAVATIALSYSKALEMAATSSGPWGWIAFAATGLATMVSTISSVKNATHYAEGGIVPGNDFTDNTPVYVSSGELILNKAQQNTLANELIRKEDGGVSVGTPYVTGEIIVLGANNHLRRTGQGEIVTTSMLRKYGLK